MQILAHLCSSFVTKPLADLPEVELEVKSPTLPLKYLPLEWILDPHKGQSLTDRILARIVQAEAKENNAHFRDDYRQAFICVALAAKGENIPFIQSSYQSYGIHPDKVWPRIVAQRKAHMGSLYHQFYDENDLLLPSPASPKKASESVRSKKEDAA